MKKGENGRDKEKGTVQAKKSLYTSSRSSRPLGFRIFAVYFLGRAVSEWRFIDESAALIRFQPLYDTVTIIFNSIDRFVGKMGNF